MPRCAPSQALVLCLLVAYVPTGWWMLHQSCDVPAMANERDRGSVPVHPAINRPAGSWVAPLLDAIEAGARDAVGGSAGAVLAQGIPEGIALEVRNLVAAKLRKAKQGVKTEPGRKESDSNAPSLAECGDQRGPVPIPPASELSMPILDGLNGRVNPVSKAPNMVANAWGIPMPNITVEVAPGRILTVDEVVYGYDLVFEAMHLFSYVSWGRVPMQQDPTDALIIADLISRLQPDCFVELGTNTGGGAIFYAEVMQQYQPKPLVVTIDVHEPTKNWDGFASKVCPHCVPVTCHPKWHEKGLIEFIKGFSQDDQVVAQVDHLLTARECKRTVVMHDSDHRGFAVERDLQIYHRFVSPGSYLIVQDTKLSRMRGGRYQTLEAVQNFLKTPAGKRNFVVDKTFEYLLFSHHHSGFMQKLAL